MKGPFLSDHRSVELDLTFPTTKVTLKQIKTRNFRKINVDEFLTDLKLENLNKAIFEAAVPVCHHRIHH